MTRINQYQWVWPGTIVLFVLSYFVAPGTLRSASIFTMLPFAAMLAVVAIGQTLVVQQRGIDMSAAGMFSLGGVLLSVLYTQGIPILPAVALTLAVALLFGIINGLLCVYVNIAPIVTTLATNALMISIVRWLSAGTPVEAPPELRVFSVGRVFGLPPSLIFAIVAVLVVAVLTTKTAFGRRFVAVGVNPAAAQIAGVNVPFYQISAYAIAAICFAIGGILLAGFIGSATHSAGNDYLLPSVAAVVIGGSSLAGGRGSVVASAVAALFITQLGQMVLSMGASAATQLLVQAGSILVVTGLRNFPKWFRMSPMQ
ncbi:MAG: ABC transporter permease [Mesorhizobium sp.]|nr:ABC transporter permease [Mesorhizobium sp. M1A.F.Ca.IN.020.32.1.1]RWF83283.1 MAG: ABC transporter permease [Mesorhizobium sp.]RWG06585.1 MAG: ABC transporter permease [Mesorhizobium sp.]RWG92762.1 MAG: ABC transporter permease [Mesorhizobium sp.]RWH06709.1 MAG: ABC transporter permease [Mesorhizobium sp.]